MGRKSKIEELTKKLGKEFCSYLLERAQAGKKPAEIAKEIGLSLSATYEYINDFNLKDKFKEAAKQHKFVEGGTELEAVLEKYYRWKQDRGDSPKTIQNNKDTFHNFIWWLRENKRPTTINAVGDQDIRGDFLHYVSVEPVRFGGQSPSSRRPAKAATVIYYRSALNALLRWAELQGLVEGVEVEKIIRRTPKPKREKRLIEDLSDEAIKKIFASFGDDFEGVRNRTAVTLFLDTGIRLAGFCGLNLKTFDLETGFGTVIEKGDKERWIRLSPKALTQLKKYLEIRESIAKTDKLWIIRDGTQWEYGTIKAWCLSLSKVAGEHVHAHLFRHIWAKFLALSEVNPLKARMMGGWADVELYQYYASAYTSKDAWKGYESASPVEKLT